MSVLRLICQQSQLGQFRPRCSLGEMTKYLVAVREQHSAPSARSKPSFVAEAPKLDSNDIYDIVINGGGIVGFSLMAALKASPFMSNKRILLIEQQAPLGTVDKEAENQNLGERTFSNRVFAITKGSRSLFERIGVWKALEPYGKVVNQMYVWGDRYQNGVHFRHSDEPEMCYIIENNQMIRVLGEKISELGADVAYETSVTDIQQLPIGIGDDIETASALGIHLQLAKRRSLEVADEEEKGRTIRTSLLVGCDGFRSLVRAKSTLPYFEVDLEQMGIVATLEVDSPFPGNDTAFQRFVGNSGLVVALLPLDESHSSLVLSLPKSKLKDWMSLTDEEFVHHLNRTLVSELGSNPLDKLINSLQSGGKPMYGTKLQPQILSMAGGSRAAFPLGFGTTVPHLVGTIKSSTPLLQTILKRDNLMNTAIIGDAAHRVHPLAGQGLNLGLGDAHQLVESLEAKARIGSELFGHLPEAQEQLSLALVAFERERIKKLVPMLAAIHSMQTVFNWTPSALLSIFDQFGWLKSGVVSFANSR